MKNLYSNAIIMLTALLMLNSNGMAQDTPVPDDESKPVVEQTAETAADDQTTEEPVPEEAVVISTEKHPHQLLWYADGVYCYTMTTFKKSGDAWITNDEEVGATVAFFGEEIMAGAKSDDDGNCVANSEAKALSGDVKVDPGKPVGYIQNRTDFRSNYYKAGETFYQAVYFTVNGKNDKGENRAYQYRVALPCKGAPVSENLINGNAVKVDGKNLVVENPAEDKKGAATSATYPMFGSAALVGEEEVVEKLKEPAAEPVATPESDTPQPEPATESTDDAVGEPANDDK